MNLWDKFLDLFFDDEIDFYDESDWDFLDDLDCNRSEDPIISEIVYILKMLREEKDYDKKYSLMEGLKEKVTDLEGVIYE